MIGAMARDTIRLTAVLGSVTAPGRLHRAVTEALQRATGADVTLIDLADRHLPFADGRPLEQLGADAPATVEAIATADAVVLATPVYRGSLTGALKNLLDLLPVAALTSKPVALVSMGGSDHHFLGADRHLRDVLAFFGALVLPTAVYLNGRDFTDGVPGERAAVELDALLAATVDLTRALAASKPLGPAPLPARF